MKSEKSSNMKGKKRQIGMPTEDPKEAHPENQMDLFAKLNMDASSDEEGDGDTTDSDDSVYSGLEDEPDTSDAESVQDEADSDDGNSSDEESGDDDDDNDDDEDDDDQDGEDDDSASSDTESKQIATKVIKKKVQRNATNTSNTESAKLSSKKTKPSSSQNNIKQHKSDTDSTSKKLTNVPSNQDSSLASAGGSTIQPKESQGGSTVPDEYEFDSSDEEDLRNTVGNIPMAWYREYEHIGYNLLGKKIIKPKTGDELDNFLNKMDNPDYWRTIVDKSTGQNVVISDKDAEFIKRLRRGKYVDSSYDPYKPWIDFFTYETMQHPVTNRPADKRSFIPSNWERLKVGRMVHAIKMGWMKPTAEKKKDDDDDIPNYYSLWEADDQSDLIRRLRGHIPAPKLALPGHEESYNPPPEYLPTEEEAMAWQDQDPEDRRSNFLPKSYPSLRQVAAYPRFINERFERCLDLYLCPRQRRMRMNVDPEDLLPKLPKPKDLQPFPITQALMYKGHTDLVRCISVDPTGQWLVSGCDDRTIKFWEVLTGRCMRTLDVGGVVKGVCWNPNTSLCLVAAIVEENVVIVNPELGDKLVISNTDMLIEGWAGDGDNSQPGQSEWHAYSEPEYSQGFRLKISHAKTLAQVTWHARGDYLAVVLQGTESKSVLIHQISRRRSQNPFRKAKGLVQCVLFHPTRPFFFVATQRYVRVYNLLKQELTKKLMTNVKWVSSMAVHPGGDNLIIGSYDCRLSWFDLDLSTKPYQTLRHHKRAIRQVCYHKKYPLFASASDDGSVIVCHGRVYNDLLQNPLIVPVKVLRGHDVKNKLGVLDCVFHPTQPWIFSSGGDNTIRLFS